MREREGERGGQVDDRRREKRRLVLAIRLLVVEVEITQSIARGDLSKTCRRERAKERGPETCVWEVKTKDCGLCRVGLGGGSWDWKGQGTGGGGTGVARIAEED